MSSSSLRRVLITGATGKQGGAVLSALLTSQPTPPFELVALTRDANSARAQALAKKPNVKVIEGDLDNISAVFGSSKQPFYGVFSVQTPKKSDEEKQGKDLVDVALANGVEHFVYSSVDRGGLERSDSDPTPIPHFRAKHNIEQHLKQKAAASPMKWTIIRPVAFMENYTFDFIGKAFVTMLDLNGQDTKLQLVSVTDIGIMAADAFKDPTRYQFQAISLATDSITPREADEIFKRVTGQPAPRTFSFVARLLKWLLREDLGIMMDWFKEKGYGADPSAIKKEYPQMQDFETWLSSSSQFRKSQ